MTKRLAPTAYDAVLNDHQHDVRSQAAEIGNAWDTITMQLRKYAAVNNMRQIIIAGDKWAIYFKLHEPTYMGEPVSNGCRNGKRQKYKAYSISVNSAKNATNNYLAHIVIMESKAEDYRHHIQRRNSDGSYIRMHGRRCGAAGVWQALRTLLSAQDTLVLRIP
jgi:hypothetical protein